MGNINIGKVSRGRVCKGGRRIVRRVESRKVEYDVLEIKR